MQVLDLTATDSDLRGYWGGFASSNYSYFVPHNNFNGKGVVDESYFGKVVRIRSTEGSLTLMVRLGITFSTWGLCS